MVLRVALGLLMVVICPAVICQQDGTPGRNTELQVDQINGTRVDSLTLASINTDFAFSVYKELALKNPDKNIVFSPLSISAALAVLSLGARNNTQEEILEGLKFNLTETPEADIHRGFGHLLHMLSQPGDQVQISTGSAMFVEKRLQILAEFKEKARVLYEAETSTTDFLQPHKAKKLINDYVRKQTQGKIKDLISGLDKDTVMVLVNYIYFKGKWKFPFDPRDTYESEFHLDKDRSVKVPMMNIEDLSSPYFRDEELACTVVELKYTGNASALFILPDEGRMQQVEASLQPETLRKWRDSLSTRDIDEFYMPKFSISMDYSLEKILPQLGIREVFSTQADLSGVTGAKDLRVSQVKTCDSQLLLQHHGCLHASVSHHADNALNLCSYQGTWRMEEVLTTALTAVPRCLALADPGASDVMDLCPRMALPCHKVSVSNIDFAFSHYRKLALPAPEENILFSLQTEAPVLADSKKELGKCGGRVPDALFEGLQWHWQGTHYLCYLLSSCAKNKFPTFSLRC